MRLDLLNRNWRYDIGQTGTLADCMPNAGATVVITGRIPGKAEPGYTVSLDTTHTSKANFWVRESELLNVR